MWMIIYLLCFLSTEPVRDLEELFIRFSIATAGTLIYYGIKHLAKMFFDEIDKED